MAMTLAEAIIAKHTKDPVEAGSICRVSVDFAFTNDITGPPAIKEFRKMGAKKVFDPARCAILPDHFSPAKDIASAEQIKECREFAYEQDMLFWEVGRVGVEHAFLPENGLVLPGEIVLGADSHTCTHGAMGALATGVGSTDLAAAWALGETWLRVPETMKVSYEGTPSEWICGKDMILALIGRIGVEGARYMALEFHGEALEKLGLDDRFTLSNMAIEAGGKTGLINPDEKLLQYARERAARHFEPIFADKDAVYASSLTIDVTDMEPQVAMPHLPENVKPVSEAAGTPVDQVFIGSCTNGRISDLRSAARILKGKKVHKKTRLMVIPASYEIYRQAMKEGLFDIFLDAGAAISTPSCGPCLGGHLGILAAGERCISTSNRNFVGRMGSPKSEVVLAGPMVAAASAVAGHICHPKEVMA
ncbi:MAG: 3-isopropylmalate dehydratase large subunit [Synergistaceae bacterium]|jgi:3-isopropylmalate/(R)-2-methylmalate dehydratase large subunit|nr:3-isopropylmalate dehydratase large subunit [Synergistaceae bacterium]MDD3319261.1 3-isopropylmalate dehydratase large subunit [Synergistaceae bacterium]MDD3673043.1 3-isopropylmalate dehydratase large subunit [Synergistaceae bacterium]MDD3964040.1 3-isopropylmalate dehydratase large subunit [Synergistaceae bacterium]MDD4705285.1 3-isopropylmalate dehydratase large subunit [Synergistaceae bacterium]